MGEKAALSRRFGGDYNAYASKGERQKKGKSKLTPTPVPSRLQSIKSIDAGRHKKRAIRY